MEISIHSPVFNEGEEIPPKYTCDGDDISPPLEWGNLPNGTQSLALICDDPDAPMGTFVHWVLYNLPSDPTGLVEDIPPQDTLENGATQGITDFKRIGYGGPCPPGGTHRYFFKLYALDTRLDLEPGASKPDLLRAMEGHILDAGQLIGIYSR